jgi:hypothetical protein
MIVCFSLNFKYIFGIGKNGEHREEKSRKTHPGPFYLILKFTDPDSHTGCLRQKQRVYSLPWNLCCNHTLILWVSWLGVLDPEISNLFNCTFSVAV